MEPPARSELCMGTDGSKRDGDLSYYALDEIVPNLQASRAIKQRSGVESVCIIGGGVSGIVTARVLLAEGLQCTLFEKAAQLGGVWGNNYTGFGIQVPSSLYEFPDEPLPRGWDFAAGKKIHGYVTQYAAKHGVNNVAKLNTAVKKITRNLTKWRVEVMNEMDGTSEEYSFDFVVISTGVYSSTDKFIPEYEGAEKFEGAYIHSVDFKDVALIEGKHVISVGYGKSAFDCAQISANKAQRSTLLFREPHWPVPRKILGLVPFEYATFNRFGIGCLKPSYPRCGPIERTVAAIPFFLTFFWWLVAQIFSLQFGLRRRGVNLKPKHDFISDFWGGHGCLPHPNFFRLVHRGSIEAKQGSIKEVRAKSVVLQSGEELPADVVIFGTGFKPNLRFLPAEVQAKKEDDGLWLYRQMIHPSFPTLCFLNSNTTTFTNITTASIQARWLVEMLKLGFPSKREMEASIQVMQAWKRKTMPNAGHARAYMMQTHQVHYYDDLLRDFGASIRRKRGLFKAAKEIFDPYRPRDYDTIVTGVFKTHPNEMVSTPGARQMNFLWELMVILLDVVVFYYIAHFCILGLQVTYQ